MRVGLLEDDPAQAELLKCWLEEAGYECRHFGLGRPFLHSVLRDNYDLLIIDWELPDISGYQVLVEVRQHLDHTIPVLFITGRDSEMDIVHALDQGADDYIVKPPRQQETLARIKVLARRQGVEESHPVFQFGAYRFNRAGREVTCNGEPIELTHKEFELALLFFINAGRILSRNYVMEMVWGQRVELQTRTLDTHMSRIRKKLALYPENGCRLSAVHNHGYRLEQLGSQ